MSDITEAVRVVRSIHLPDLPISPKAMTEGTEDPGAAARVIKDSPQMVVGSQLVDFDAAFPADLRADVANGFLLAQLAADRALTDAAADGQAGAKLWQDTYIATLTLLGWFIEARTESQRTASSATGQVHKEIIPVLTAALGSAAAVVIIKLLEGLQQMAADKPWITLFDFESRRASSNLFQMSNATLAGDTPAIRVVCFHLTAQNEVTQVLFVKLGEMSADLHHVEVALRVNRAQVAALRAAVVDRVTPYLADRIAALI